MTKVRPIGVIALLTLFAIGTCASFIAAVSLAFPGSFLKPIWQLNPHAREGFNRIGAWAIVLMAVVCIACILTTIGLWRGRRWGYWLALLMLVMNLFGDLINVISGTEPRAIIGIVIVVLLLVFVPRTHKSLFREWRL